MGLNLYKMYNIQIWVLNVLFNKNIRCIILTHTFYFFILLYKHSFQRTFLIIARNYTAIQITLRQYQEKGSNQLKPIFYLLIFSFLDF